MIETQNTNVFDYVAYDDEAKKVQEERSVS